MEPMRLCVIAATLLLLSCAHIPKFENSAVAPVATLRVWIQDDPLITTDLVMDGCKYWTPVGVRCKRVAKPEDADIRVRVSHETCLDLARRRVAEIKAGRMSWNVPLKPECKVPLPEEGAEIDELWGMLALATTQGDITMFPSCIAWSGGGMIIPDMVRVTAAHEFGHEMGIEHVPSVCDDPCTEYKFVSAGKKLCGPAIMNAPSIDTDYITPIDAAAFGLRDSGRPPHAK